MSTNFEIFPTGSKIPDCKSVIDYSVNLLNKFLRDNKIIKNIDVTAKEVTNEIDDGICPQYLALNENNYTVFNVNNEGEAYVHYYKNSQIDKKFWTEEISINKNAQSLKDKIYANMELGYSWSVKRTMGQPAIVSLYYGYLAIAIAVLTNGIIYSDDGAWDYSRLPVDGKDFEREYLNIENVTDIQVRENVKRWLDEVGI